MDIDHPLERKVRSISQSKKLDFLYLTKTPKMLSAIIMVNCSTLVSHPLLCHVTVWIFRVYVANASGCFSQLCSTSVEIGLKLQDLPRRVESLVTLPIESAINGTPA